VDPVTTPTSLPEVPVLSVSALPITAGTTVTGTVMVLPVVVPLTVSV
jgi:hypothetical protein